MRFLRSALTATTLFLASLTGAQAAQVGNICISVNTPVVVHYTTGTMSIVYQICANPLKPQAVSWEGVVTYNNVSWGDGFTVNGSTNLQINFTGDAISSINFNGGPLTFTIGGHPYAVTFDNLQFAFTTGFQVSSATGGLTINGVTANADAAYWQYLFH